MREREVGEPRTGADWPGLLAPTPGRVLTAVLLAVATFVGAGALAAASDAGETLLLASFLFFPLRMHLYFRGAFRETVQDFTVCRFPGCDEVALLLTVALSVAVYWVLGCAIHGLVAGATDGGK